MKKNEQKHFPNPKSIILLFAVLLLANYSYADGGLNAMGSALEIIFLELTLILANLVLLIVQIFVRNKKLAIISLVFAIITLLYLLNGFFLLGALFTISKIIFTLLASANTGVSIMVLSQSKRKKDSGIVLDE